MFSLKRTAVATVFAMLSVITVANGQTQPNLTLKANGGEVTCIGFSADGKAFFSGALDSYVTVWTTRDWKQTANIEPAPAPKAAAGEHQDEYRGLDACAAEPNTRRVMIASGGDLASTYSLPGGTQIVSHHLAANFGSLAVSPDGSKLAVGYGSKIVILALDTWKRLGTLSASGTIGTLRYAPKGNLLAAGIDHGGVQLWNTETATLVSKLKTVGNVEQLSFSRDGHWLAAAIRGSEQNPHVQIWNPTTGSEERRLTGHTDSVWGVAFSPDDRFLASSDTGGNVRLWKVGGWQECRKLSAAGGQQIAISPDGHWLAAGGGTQEISVWDFRELVQSCH